MRILMAGGGTGGHLIPALNIARELSARYRDADIRFVGTVRGLENRIIPEEGYPLELLPVVPFSRSFSWNWFRFPIALCQSISKTARLIKQMRTQCVVATGGYVSGPAIFAAKLKRIPVVLCEQNSYPGLTTRIGSLFANAVCLGLPGAKQHLWRRSRAELIGNPVEIPSEMPDRADLLRAFGLDPNILTVLVTGGSQGAASINRAMVEMVEGGLQPDDVQFLWQTGSKKLDEVKAALDRVPSNVTLFPFIRPMWNAYHVADIVIARCGALTLSEISVFGLPAILIPYPYAAADHQRLNALSFAKSGAATVIPDDKTNGVTLASALRELIEQKDKRQAMASESRKLGRPNALVEIVTKIEDMVKNDSVS